MSMVTNLNGRLRNTSLPLSHGLSPLFEAVVNSIQAIEEAGLSTNKGSIQVKIIRTNQQEMNYDSSESKNLSEIIGFEVTDNGIGFNNENFESFRIFDTEHKANKGCRGVGRLLWLKAFQTVKIDSIFLDDKNNKILREFTFNSKDGVTEPKLTKTSKEKQTTVILSGFFPQYRKASKKSGEAIANSLFEHCLWYFLRVGGAPHIVIYDNDDMIKLVDIYEKHMVEAATSEDITIKDKKFNLTHIKLKNSSSKNNEIAYCAANRLVKEENINGKISGLFGILKDNDTEFIYACYVNSDYLNDKVRAERTGFDIADTNIENMFSNSELTFKEIKDSILKKIEVYLNPYLENNRLKTKERLDEFVSKKAPRYRPIISRISEEELNIDPSISDRDLDLVLHKHLSELENQLLLEGHELMKPSNIENEEDYHKRLHEYLSKAEDIKKSDLANYISHRKVILDLLENAIQRQVNGKYVREDLIHQLIMPMGKDSNQIFQDSCNLWLLDERLAFHNYLASDKTLSSMPITDSKRTKEPDLLALNICDNPILVSEKMSPPFASIVVVEFKRPMRDDAAEGEEKDPIEQALFYIDRIRNGKVQTANGRPIPSSDSIPGFCYVISDLTESILKRCRIHQLKITSDGLGYFGYNDDFKTYIEVISFDKLVNSAKERNKAFFDKLGLPTT